MSRHSCLLFLTGTIGMAFNYVKKIREELLISKSELARRAGISPVTIDNIEKGHACRLDTKRKIITALGFKVSDREKLFPEDEKGTSGKDA